MKTVQRNQIIGVAAWVLVCGIAGAADITQGPPPKDRPAIPGWGFYPQFPHAWKQMHESFLQRTRQGGIDIVFFGDSITQGWGGDGQAVWKEHFEPLRAVNYGIGGDTTRQVLWRIDHGEIDGLKPRLVVLLIGTNNLYGDHNSGSDEEIAEGVKATVDKLRSRAPGAKILLPGLLPRQNEYFCGRIERINTLIRKLDDGRIVRFLDLKNEFQESFGVVKKELYHPDQLHLVEAGYRAWARAMMPLLQEMLRD